MKIINQNLNTKEKDVFKSFSAIVMAFLMLFTFQVNSALAQETLRVYASKPGQMVTDIQATVVGEESFNSFTDVPETDWAPLPGGFSSSVGTFFQIEGDSDIRPDDQFGAGTGNFLSIGVGGVVELEFDEEVNYFGFAWPAGDRLNSVEIFSDGRSLGVFTTEDLVDLLPRDANNTINAVNGDSYITIDYYGKPGTGDTPGDRQNNNEPYAYLHFVASDALTFDKVEFSMPTAGGRFEIDNPAIIAGIPPVNGTWVELFSHEPPVAENDLEEADPGETVTVDVLANDTPNDAPLDPSSVTIIGSDGPGESLEVPGEGTWSVNTSNGAITFTPEGGFMDQPSPIEYFVRDTDGFASNIATVTIIVESAEIVNKFPAADFGTVAFEDLWPAKGDYDFNDVVVDYQFKVTSNSSNYVEEIEATFILRAFGAGFRNGFGFQFGGENISSGNLTVSGSSITENFINLGSDGLEQGQSRPTIIVFDNAFNEMQHPGTGTGVNTEPSAPFVTPAEFTIQIDVSANTYTFNDFDFGNFRPFIFVDRDRSREVHLAGNAPTDLVDSSLFGTRDDDSDPASGRWYVSENNLPWGLNFPERFDYPIERADITEAYLKFFEWAESGGVAFPDWFSNTSSDFRNNSKIYSEP